LGNQLVIVVPADSTLRIARPEDLLDERVRRLALGDVDSVPAGIYARQALTKLSLWEKLRGKVVNAADVRQALQFVQTGAADAGIVYATDGAVAKQVRVAAVIDSKLTEPIRYPLVLLKTGAKNPAAIELFEFLASDGAAAVFRKYGFQLPSQVEKAGGSNERRRPVPAERQPSNGGK
jgi:molybdate transport system substrate-binding protein